MTQSLVSFFARYLSKGVSISDVLTLYNSGRISLEGGMVSDDDFKSIDKRCGLSEDTHLFNIMSILESKPSIEAYVAAIDYASENDGDVLLLRSNFADFMDSLPFSADTERVAAENLESLASLQEDDRMAAFYLKRAADSYTRLLRLLPLSDVEPRMAYRDDLMRVYEGIASKGDEYSKDSAIMLSFLDAS